MSTSAVRIIALTDYPAFVPSRSLVHNYWIVRTTQDRRGTSNTSLPYITQEGLVLVDRREYKERRIESRKH
jgi:hypothetical protein